MHDVLLFLLAIDGELDVRHPDHDDVELHLVVAEHLHPELLLLKESVSAHPGSEHLLLEHHPDEDD